MGEKMDDLEDGRGRGASPPPSFMVAKGRRPGSGMSNMSAAGYPEKLPTCQDWTGPNDPDNPLNWPPPKRIFNTALPALIALVCTFASSSYSAGLSDVVEDLHTTEELARLSYSIYILGMAVGAVITAPCSETFGRRPVYLTAIPIFAVFNLGSGFCRTIAGVTTTRFLAGIFASPGLSIGSGTISDMWPPAKRSLPMAVYITTPFLGPALGPLLGGFVVEYRGWPWTFWVVLLFVIAFFTPTIFMSETYKQAILQKRAKRLGVEGPPSPSKGKSASQVAKYFVAKTLTRPLSMLVTEPVVAAFSTWVAFNFALLYAFFTAFQYVYETQYGFSVSQIGLTFLGVGVGSLAGFCWIVGPDQIMYRRALHKAKQRDAQTVKLRSEYRLPNAMLGAILIPPGLFLFGWSAQYKVHWIAPVIGEGLFGMGNLLVFMTSITYIMDFYGPLYGASAAAANTLLRYLVAFALPLVSVQMYKGLGVGWASSLLGFISAALATIPFVLWFVGPKLRERSSYKHGTG